MAAGRIIFFALIVSLLVSSLSALGWYIWGWWVKKKALKLQKYHERKNKKFK